MMVENFSKHAQKRRRMRACPICLGRGVVRKCCKKEVKFDQNVAGEKTLKKR